MKSATLLWELREALCMQGVVRRGPSAKGTNG